MSQLELDLEFAWFISVTCQNIDIAGCNQYYVSRQNI